MLTRKLLATSALTSNLMPAFDFVVSSLSRLQAKVHEMPLLFAAFTTIVYFTVKFSYRGQTSKVITIAFFLVQQHEAQCYKT